MACTLRSSPLATLHCFTSLPHPSPRPARPQARDACGYHYFPSDAHLANGAYLHLAEIAVNIAALGAAATVPEAAGNEQVKLGASDGASSAVPRRRCDPPPYEPPPDAVAFSETKGSGLAGDNLAFRLSIRPNVMTGKYFTKPPPPGGRDEAFFATLEEEPGSFVAAKALP